MFEHTLKGCYTSVMTNLIDLFAPEEEYGNEKGLFPDPIPHSFTNREHG